MPAFEWVHVQLHQQKGMISLSPPTICNSAAQKLILEVDDSYRPSDFKIVKEVVKALHQADERATDFRYARRNDGTRSLEGIHYVNTRRFGEKMGEASDLLDGVDNGLRYLLDCKAEWNQILDSF
ncbi:hypothetical+protein [Escherichia coli]|uniref:Uncharacterized protein n=4 Tax=Enterobacterales TaxID=91347 RepID=A0A2K9V112_ECOLX|nr:MULTISPECIES: hypothetical protein [Enterobacteriaceae]EAR5384215.1 hypothetical protein [Salmonella enterica]EBF8311652.1 hypothetical protein [Salmonella enterica subsp. enterica serovar Tamberma]EEM3184178.1 hypothetical protein [Salmonella enterica subsp. enterica serovar Enteritidis]EGF6180686.1 hypothetical protein [Salmonella enterica subsp. enterica serovar Heidelberg]AUV50965.1 hypothetical protein [Escherichia coli]